MIDDATWTKLLKFKRFLSEEALARQTKLALSLTPREEVINQVIGSYALGTAGPLLKSLWFVTNKLVCEVRIKDESGGVEFDFAPRMPVNNIRVSERTHIIKENDIEIARFEYSQIVATFANSILNCAFEFVGNSEDLLQWRQEVLSVFPVASLTPLVAVPMSSDIRLASAVTGAVSIKSGPAG